MGVTFNEKERIFKLDTPNTSYILGIGDEFGHLVHIYYGKSIASTDNLVKMPTVDAKNKVWYFDGTKMEYPTGDIGDFREHCIEIKNEKGQHALECGYVSHKIYKGKPKLEGLPATFSNEEDCTTLEIVMKDAIAGVELTLVYSAFEKLDVITRSLIVKNICDEKIKLTKVMSACLDVENNDFEMLTLHGSWGRERNIQSKRIGYGRQGIYSERGVSGHQDHPFIALIEHGTSQTMGEVYAMNFVYSGNFEAQCELNQHDTVRLVMGINPYQFEWTLNGGEIFTAPEVVMVYSSEGLGKMTRTYHDLYRNHLIRGKYRSVKRPVLINNWEATYFDFNTEKLLSIAKKAS